MFVNRLKEYLNNNPVTWRKLQETLDVSTTTICKIVKIDSEDGLRWISLGTYKALRDKIGVDMLDCEIN